VEGLKWAQRRSPEDWDGDSTGMVQRQTRTSPREPETVLGSSELK
jgi:hypothetical protein